MQFCACHSITICISNFVLECNIGHIKDCSAKQQINYVLSDSVDSARSVNQIVCNTTILVGLKIEADRKVKVQNPQEALNRVSIYSSQYYNLSVCLY